MNIIGKLRRWASRPIRIPLAFKPVHPAVQRHERWMAFSAFVYGLLLGSCLGVAAEVRRENVRVAEVTLLRVRP